VKRWVCLEIEVEDDPDLQRLLAGLNETNEGYVVLEVRTGMRTVGTWEVLQARQDP
jgi:hypothetical protein